MVASLAILLCKQQQLGRLSFWFLSLSPLAIFTHFRQHSYYHWSASAKSATLRFLYRIPTLLGGLLSEGEVGHLALHPWPTVRTLSNIAKEPAATIAPNISHVLTCSFFIPLSNSLGNHIANFLESFRSLWRMAGTVFLLHLMGLSEISDALSPDIFHLGGDISNAFVMRFSVPPSPLPGSAPSPIDNHLYLCSLQGLVIIDLLDNFLKLLKAFSSCGK